MMRLTTTKFTAHSSAMMAAKVVPIVYLELADLVHELVNSAFMYNLYILIGCP